MAAAALLSVMVSGPIGVSAASLKVSWQAPTTNTDGTPLIDLVGYRVYVAPSSPACGGPSFIYVTSPVAAPSGSQTVSSLAPGLAGTTYAVAVTAINASHVESTCSPEAIGVARADFTVAPSSVDFGSAVVGASVDRIVTVQNVSTASLSGTAIVSAPFTVISGSSYSVAPGARQDVVVRFLPTVDGTFIGNINFTAGGDTISRGVAGTAMLPSAALSSVTPDKTAPQTVGTTVTFTATATGGTAPYQFKWWLNTDGGPVWTLLQDWSTSNTLMWTPTVANSGYQIATWVRNKFTNFAINPSPSPP